MQNDAESRKLKFVTQSQKCSKKVDGRGKKKARRIIEKAAIFQKNNSDATLICFVCFAQKSKGET